MNTKMLSILAIIILLVFGIGYSIGSFTNQESKSPVKAVSNVTFGKAPLEVSFSYLITGYNGEVKRCIWDFNDGEKSSVPHVTHTFHRQGTFNVSLTVWTNQDHKFHDTLEIEVIEFHKPIASATASKSYGKVPLTVQFTGDGFDVDGKELKYLWNFDDETTSNEQNPAHTFENQGNYTVRLTVTDADDQQDTDVIHIYAIGNYPPIASISADRTEGKAPLSVKFEGHCHDIDSENVTYQWYFENSLLKKNRESSSRNANHTFYFPGTYVVTLTVEDEDGDQDTETVKIIVRESRFSRATDYLFDTSKTMFIKGALAKFIGSFFGEFLASFFGRISGNLLGSLL
jgi:PKD repeat protein